MTNAMARLVPATLLVLAAGSTLRAEDYQCGEDAGCTARITEDGELQEVVFRKGDLVSTEAGWVVSSDDGWVKVKTKGGKSL
jgi:hypothetical protein